MIHIRTVSAEDLSRVLDLTARLADFPLPPGRTPEEIARADHPILRAQVDAPREDVLFLLAEEKPETPLGVIFANTRADYFTGRQIAYVEVLAVAEPAAGRGIGRLLMQAVEEWAAARGLARVDLMVFSVNQRARAFYERLGYRAEFSRYVKPLQPATIIPFRERDAEAFYQLNRLWLDAHELYEPPDERQLADPAGEILEPGGAIFVAVLADTVVGTAAVVPHGLGVVELAKLTVADSARGQGLGRRLAVRCLDHARAMGAHRAVLVSSTRLGPALRLYESLGFTHRAPPATLAYATADVYMELELGATTAR
jgi:putative acetyltransferase